MRGGAFPPEQQCPSVGEKLRIVQDGPRLHGSKVFLMYIVIFLCIHTWYQFQFSFSVIIDQEAKSERDPAVTININRQTRRNTTTSIKLNSTLSTVHLDQENSFVDLL